MRYVIVFVAIFAMVIAFIIGEQTDSTTLLIVGSTMLGTVLGALITAGACALAGGFRNQPVNRFGDEKPVIIVQPQGVEPEKPRFRYPTDYIPRDKAIRERKPGKRREVYIVGDE